MKDLQRVLYVEDDPDIQAVARVALEVVGRLTVKICSSGEDALRDIAAFAPDMVLLDVMMPGELDGYQVCERIKRDPATSLTRVVLLTARGQRADLEQGKKAGCDSYLIKPFSPLALIDLLDKLLADPQEN